MPGWSLRSHAILPNAALRAWFETISSRKRASLLSPEAHRSVRMSPGITELREGDLCDLSGSFFAFAPTKSQRIASSDPRVSLQERYGKRQGYVDAVSEAGEDLVGDRLLMPADADNIIAAAQSSNVLQ